MPYTVQLQNFNYTAEPKLTDTGETIEEVNFYGGSIMIYGKQSIITSFEKQILKSIGAKHTKIKRGKVDGYYEAMISDSVANI